MTPDARGTTRAPIDRRRFGRTFWILVAGISLSAGSYFAWGLGAPGRAAAARMQALLAGTGSAAVTFFRLDPHSGIRPADTGVGHYLQQWKILQEKPLREPEVIENIRATLLRPGTYGSESFRCFDPGLGFRWKTESRTIEFVICLSCKHLYAYEAGSLTTWVLSDGGVDRLMKVYKAHAEADAK